MIPQQHPTQFSESVWRVVQDNLLDHQGSGDGRGVGVPVERARQPLRVVASDRDAEQPEHGLQDAQVRRGQAGTESDT